LFSKNRKLILFFFIFQHRKMFVKN
jgi:hypothetical protein